MTGFEYPGGGKRPGGTYDSGAIDFTRLGTLRFEKVCGELLKAIGIPLETQVWRARDIGADYVAISSDSKRIIFESVHFRGSSARLAEIRRRVYELDAARAYAKAERAVLMLSIPLPAPLEREFQVFNWLTVWDEPFLQLQLASHPDVQRYAAEINDWSSFKEERTNELDAIRGDDLLRRLDTLEPGRDQWREYENLGTEILAFAFHPNLGAPVTQARSDNGLNIMDAVYTVRGRELFWEEIRRFYKSRFVVAEFKNLSDPVTQTEVDCLGKYLMPKAQRLFGLLCSRKSPSNSAQLARRDQWMGHEKMILMLSDIELRALIHARLRGEDPTQLLDHQLEQFLLPLTW